MAQVTLRNIRKVYPRGDAGRRRRRNTGPGDAGGDVAAVRDFNLEIAHREFVVLVGPSGCGKSTTLRMVAGLEEISGGQLYIDGQLMNHVAPKDRDIAMVFQSYALYPHMTVYENMAFALKLKKEDRAVIDRKVRQAAEILNITPYLDRKPKALSGGQRQRVAIGRAIVRSPKVFLMDEPLSNLDAKLRNQMRAELAKLRQRMDTTFLYVTHDQTEAMTLGDRIVVMKDGVIQQVGTPQQVFCRPANRFVAGFIGVPQMNFFDGRLRETGGEYTVELGETALALSPDRQRALRENRVPAQAVAVGVRPEHIRLCPHGAEGIGGKVEVAEMMGSAVHLHVDAGGSQVIIAAENRAAPGAGAPHVSVGQEIFFALDGAAAHIFSRETGQNLEYEPEKPE